MGRKHGAKLRADEQEPDTRRRRVGRAGERVIELLRRFFAGLKLRINKAKSAVDLATDRKFPGYSFWIGTGRKVHFRLAGKTLARMKGRVRRITR